MRAHPGNVPTHLRPPFSGYINDIKVLFFITNTDVFFFPPSASANVVLAIVQCLRKFPKSRVRYSVIFINVFLRCKTDTIAALGGARRRTFLRSAAIRIIETRSTVKCTLANKSVGTSRKDVRSNAMRFVFKYSLYIIIIIL